MDLRPIPKQETVPAFDPNAIRIKHIMQNLRPYRQYEGDEITEALVKKLLEQAASRCDMILSLDPNGEDDWMEVLCDGEWLALGYSSGGGQENYYSYNPAFAGDPERSPLLSGGQTPVEKYLALQDIEAGVQAVGYSICTGGLYPGIDWAKQL